MKNKKVLFTVDENGEGYKKAIQEMYDKDLYTKLYYDSNISQDFDIKYVITLKDDIPFKVLEGKEYTYNVIEFLLYFEKDKYYLINEKYNSNGLFYINLLNKRIYLNSNDLDSFNIEVYKYDEYLYNPIIPNFSVYTYINKDINENNFYDESYFYNHKNDIINAYDISNSVYNNEGIRYLNKNSIKAFILYKRESECQYGLYDNSYIDNLKVILLKFKCDYSIERNNVLLYFEKDKTYPFYSTEDEFCLSFLQYFNIIDYKHIILSITEELNNKVNISAPNIIFDLLNFNIDEIINYIDKEINDDSLYCFDFDPYGKRFIYEILDEEFNEQHIHSGCLYGRMIKKLC